jgi:uncharacterized protein (UPF0128 family)
MLLPVFLRNVLHTSCSECHKLTRISRYHYQYYGNVKVTVVKPANLLFLLPVIIEIMLQDVTALNLNDLQRSDKTVPLYSRSKATLTNVRREVDGF